VFWKLFVRHFGSWASLQCLSVLLVQITPGPTVLPTTKFEGSPECPYCMVPD